jgi:hypothetical protein
MLTTGLFLSTTPTSSMSNNFSINQSSIPALPEGYVLLGMGRSFSLPLANLAELSESLAQFTPVLVAFPGPQSSWTPMSNTNYRQSTLAYAVPVDSFLAHHAQNPLIIEQLNRVALSNTRRGAEILPIPEDEPPAGPPVEIAVPVVPRYMNYHYMGKGSRDYVFPDYGFYAIVHEDYGINARLSYVRQPVPELHYHAPYGSGVIERMGIELPEVPEDYVILGPGGTFDAEGMTHGYCLDLENPEEENLNWEYCDSLTGSMPSLWYAVHEDDPTVARNNILRVEDIPIAADQVVPSEQPKIKTEPEIPTGPIRYILTLNGKPIGSRRETETEITPLLCDPASATELAKLLWIALFNEKPEEVVDSWIEKEPIVMGGINFLPRPEEGTPSTSLSMLEENPQVPISDLIVRATAGALLAGEVGEHWVFTEDRTLVINTANPPPLENGYEMMRRILSIRETGEKLDNMSCWLSGMAIDQLERLYGDDFDMSAVVEQTGRVYNTLVTTLNVYRAFGGNRRKLSFTHHKEAYYSRIEDHQREWVLDQAEDRQFTVAEMRKLLSYVRNYGDDGIENLSNDPPANKYELLERLEVRGANRNYLFQLLGCWYEYRGPYEHIPNGASPIFNADTRELIEGPAQARRLTTWTPVGIEIPHTRGHAAVLEQNRELARSTGGEVERSSGGNRHAPLVEIPSGDEVAQIIAEYSNDDLAEEDPLF